MTQPAVRALAALPLEAWRNGRGKTRTLAARAGAWRVSLADVEHDGPYSRFAGMTRLSLVLSGAGVVLREGALEVSLAPNEAVAYTGDAEWHARLVGGAVSVLNVMSATGRYAVAARLLDGPARVPAGLTALVIALDGACRCGASGQLRPGDFATFTELATALNIVPDTPQARVVLVTLAPTHE
ncbi:conserved hypothetical protein [Paraburkholderia tropica]|uniref:HutD/Ves family protein n=1 Tax=Paraburkholderia tropica TaxID=92647 RepID=UPI001CAE98CE|nr:HutD family protein [Paraburkholderia tropica]CAG9216765.1 conserved hypothetical protein [Paraburkholderia tropica]